MTLPVKTLHTLDYFLNAKINNLMNSHLSAKRSTLYALIGPTCTFKTKISIDLAEKNNFEIISADSRLVYKEMDIGTSKPTVEERKNIPHYMIDLIFPNEDYSVALYKREAEKNIENIFKKGKIPLFVGGTGLYLNSVLSGLSIPEVKPDKELRNELKTVSQNELYKRLCEMDPEAAKKIHENDKFRTIRAIEIISTTGELFSVQQKKKDLPFDVVWIGLTYKDRNLHKEKIQKRTEIFLANGFVDEVKILLDKYGELDLFKNTIGYSEALDFLNNKINKDEMIEKITLSTKQLAKRQMTWFRANKEIKWVYLDDFNPMYDFLDIESFPKISMLSKS